MGQITATDARAALPDLLDRVEGGEEITITRHGRPVAVVVPIGALRSRRAADAFEAADRLRDLLDESAGGRSGRTSSPPRCVRIATGRDRAMDAFDADVLIYAAAPGHPLGRRVLPLLESEILEVRIGSVLLLPEVLSKPLRTDAVDEVRSLARLLGRLELRPVDQATARLASVLGAAHGLRAADAVHLATAVAAGADRFITNNERDFPTTIGEIDVTYPVDLPDPT